MALLCIVCSDEVDHLKFSLVRVPFRSVGAILHYLTALAESVIAKRSAYHLVRYYVLHFLDQYRTLAMYFLNHYCTLNVYLYIIFLSYVSKAGDIKYKVLFPIFSL